MRASSAPSRSDSQVFSALGAFPPVPVIPYGLPPASSLTACLPPVLFASCGFLPGLDALSRPLTWPRLPARARPARLCLSRVSHAHAVRARASLDPSHARSHYARHAPLRHTRTHDVSASATPQSPPRPAAGADPGLRTLPPSLGGPTGRTHAPLPPSSRPTDRWPAPARGRRPQIDAPRVRRTGRR